MEISGVTDINKFNEQLIHNTTISILYFDIPDLTDGFILSLTNYDFILYVINLYVY